MLLTKIRVLKLQLESNLFVKQKTIEEALFFLNRYLLKLSNTSKQKKNVGANYCISGN